MRESNYFINIIKRYFPSKKIKIIFDGDCLIIELNDSFFLRIVSINKLYQIDFFSNDVDMGMDDFYRDRDFSVSFFDIVCEILPSINFDFNSYYPVNFEETDCFKEYYIKGKDYKGDDLYGLNPEAVFRFIRINYDQVLSIVNGRVY